MKIKIFRCFGINRLWRGFHFQINSNGDMHLSLGIIVINRYGPIPFWVFAIASAYPIPLWAIHFHKWQISIGIARIQKGVK